MSPGLSLFLPSVEHSGGVVSTPIKWEGGGYRWSLTIPYYTTLNTVEHRTYVVVQVGPCLPVDRGGWHRHVSSCANVPRYDMSMSDLFSFLFLPSTPIHYNASHLVDASFTRYPPLPGPMPNLVTPGVGNHSITYHFRGVSLHALLSCNAGLSVDRREEMEWYRFNTSVTWIRARPPYESANPQVYGECVSIPYSVGIHRGVRSAVAWETGSEQTHVEYEPCPEGYRLHFQVELEFPRTSGYVQGAVNVDGSHCVGFPSNRSTWWSEANGPITRMVLHLRTECHSLVREGEVDCGFFHTCEEDGVLDRTQEDYEMSFRRMRCPEHLASCLTERGLKGVCDTECIPLDTYTLSLHYPLNTCPVEGGGCPPYVPSDTYVPSGTMVLFILSIGVYILYIGKTRSWPHRLIESVVDYIRRSVARNWDIRRHRSPHGTFSSPSLRAPRREVDPRRHRPRVRSIGDPQIAGNRLWTGV
jgi:hypothetical protein